MRIAWATGANYAEIDNDLPFLTDAARARGIDAEVVVWDDPAVDWAAFDLVVVRSCWDYVPRRAEFLQWARTVPRLQNSAALLEWNTDKTYLRQLIDHGVATVETAWSVRDGDELPEAQEWVVKPAISAGSADTARWSEPTQVYAHSERLLADGRVSMIQPYVASVDSDGETGLLYFGGQFSHAFRKGALLVKGTDPRAEPEMQEDISAQEPTSEQIEFGLGVLAAARAITGEDPLYARVDVVTDHDGALRLMELELAEPSFFLEHAPKGAASLIDAIA